MLSGTSTIMSILSGYLSNSIFDLVEVFRFICFVFGWSIICKKVAAYDEHKLVLIFTVWNMILLVIILSHACIMYILLVEPCF